MIFKSKSKFDMLDQYLAHHDYTAALEAIVEEIKRKPENFNLLLRQAEILGLAGDREAAITIYRKLARQFAEDGFYARAIAVTKKLLRLDPEHPEVTRELAGFISAKQEAEETARQRFKSVKPARSTPARAPVPPPPPPPEPEVSEALLDEPEPPAEPEPAAHVPYPEPPTAVILEPPSPQQAEKEREASRFFAEFPQRALEELLDSTSVRSFAAQETIVREGDPGLSLFLIEEGSVEVITKDPSGHPLVLSHMGAGEFFGEVSVLTGRPRTATIVATSPVTAIEIYKGDLDRIASQHPGVREVLRRFYEQRAHATVEAMLGRLRGQRE